MKLLKTIKHTVRSNSGFYIGTFKVFETEKPVTVGKYSNRAGDWLTVKDNDKNGRTFSGKYHPEIEMLQKQNPNTLILFESDNGSIVCCVPPVWHRHLEERNTYSKLKG